MRSEVARVLYPPYMYTMAWSDGSKPDRTPRVGPTAQRNAVAEVEERVTPASGDQDISCHNPVETAIETRPGWRPEQFPGTEGGSRQTTSERLQARQPVSRMTANPFLVGQDYMNTLALQEAFLLPRSSHAGRTEST